MPPKNIGPRAEYRLQESQRARDSASLADKFPHLRSLTVDLAFGNTEGTSQRNELKYRVNLVNAKSVFRFDCPNSECVGGDFDLSNDLLKAYAEHRATVSGEARCPGWRSKATVGSCRCQNILHFKFSLLYDAATPAAAVAASA